MNFHRPFRVLDDNFDRIDSEKPKIRLPSCLDSTNASRKEITALTSTLGDLNLEFPSVHHEADSDTRTLTKMLYEIEAPIMNAQDDVVYQALLSDFRGKDDNKKMRSAACSETLDKFKTGAQHKYPEKNCSQNEKGCGTQTGFDILNRVGEQMGDFIVTQFDF